MTKIVSVPRFRIVNLYDGTTISRQETTQESFDFLKNEDSDLLQDAIIEDLLEDISVPATEFVQAFLDGETPEDLTFF